MLADTAGMVVVEYLLTKAMTASAKGTAEALGCNVRQKAGLNRAIIDTSWGALRRNLQYKVTVSAAYASQRCHRCGTVNAASRRTQPRFACVSCGHESNADILSALNILASGTGLAQLDGEGRWRCPPMDISPETSLMESPVSPTAFQGLRGRSLPCRARYRD